jgi:hypothetical protein
MTIFALSTMCDSSLVRKRGCRRDAPKLVCLKQTITTMSDEDDHITSLASWTDEMEVNRALPKDYDAPENAGKFWYCCL